MSGTEWTEPGQGATPDELGAALAYRHNWNARAWQNLDNIGGGSFRANRTYKTDLRLTGADLTADDLKRIAEAR